MTGDAKPQTTPAPAPAFSDAQVKAASAQVLRRHRELFRLLKDR